jgi:hypothetical protein
VRELFTLSFAEGSRFSEVREACIAKCNPAGQKSGGKLRLQEPDGRVALRVSEWFVWMRGE